VGKAELTRAIRIKKKRKERKVGATMHFSEIIRKL